MGESICVNMTRFRGLAAIGAAAGIAAGAAEIIRRQGQGKSAELIPPVVEPGSAARATNTMTNEVGHGKTADLPATGSGAQSVEPPGSLPPSGASGPSPDLSKICKLPEAQARKTAEPSFIRYWIVALLVVAVGCGFASFCFLKKGFFSNDNPPHATGGLLMFTAEPTSSQIPTAAVVVDSHKSDGFPGVSILEVTLIFEHARPGLRWYIAASGQYAPKINMPLPEFCADATAVLKSSIISCRNNAGHGYRDATYNFKDHIGSLDGSQIRDVGDSLPGYINTNTVIVSGTLTKSFPIGPPGTLASEIWIPFRSPDSTEIGSDTYFAYAPMAINYYTLDLGPGALIGQIANPHSTASFGDSAAHMPLDYLQVSSLDLTIEAGKGKDELARASPPTVQSDQLQWHTTGNGIGAISFTFHNPFVADQLSRDIFIAAIFISIGATALLLLLEKLIERLIEWRRLRASNHHPAQGGSTGGQAGSSHLGTRPPVSGST